MRSAAALVLLPMTLLACASGDDTSSPETTPAPVTTTAPAPTSTTTLPAATTIPDGPVLADRIDVVEVSLRIVSSPGSGDDALVASIAVGRSDLADVPDPGEPVGAAAWCSGLDATPDVEVDDDAVPDAGAVPDTDPDAIPDTDPDAIPDAVPDGGVFVVRVSEPAVGTSVGGLERFELTAAELPDGIDPVAATVEIAVDGEPIVVPDASMSVLGDPSAGTFRGTAADGTVVEGAFRCAAAGGATTSVG